MAVAYRDLLRIDDVARHRKSPPLGLDVVPIPEPPEGVLVAVQHGTDDRCVLIFHQGSPV